MPAFFASGICCQTADTGLTGGVLYLPSPRMERVMKVLAMLAGFLLATVTTIGAAQPGDLGYTIVACARV